MKCTCMLVCLCAARLEHLSLERLAQGESHDGLREGYTEHRHHSARMLCRRMGPSLNLEYSGSITTNTKRELDRRVSVERRACVATLEKISRALTMFDEPTETDFGAFPEGTAPSAVIVREDQFAATLKFCQALGRRGSVLRTCWLEVHQRLAEQWVAQF